MGQIFTRRSYLIALGQDFKKSAKRPFMKISKRPGPRFAATGNPFLWVRWRLISAQKGEERSNCILTPLRKKHHSMREEMSRQRILINDDDDDLLGNYMASRTISINMVDEIIKDCRILLGYNSQVYQLPSYNWVIMLNPHSRTCPYARNGFIIFRCAFYTSFLGAFLRPFHTPVTLLHLDLGQPHQS